jgi:hypothetical protein
VNQGHFYAPTQRKKKQLNFPTYIIMGVSGGNLTQEAKKKKKKKKKKINKILLKK